MEMKKREVYRNKPIYLGQAVLDLSKMLMYEFWYDYFKPTYSENIKLCYTDTGSLIFSVKTNVFIRILVMILKNGLRQVHIAKILIEPYKKVSIKR